MKSTENLTIRAEAIKALAHPLRLEIINVLAKKELCFTDILDMTDASKSNLSQHLSKMTDAGLLNSRRDRRCVFFSVSSPKVPQACKLLTEVLKQNISSKKRILGSK